MTSSRLGSGIPACGFVVQATKAGQLPLSIEKRAKGKKVTVIGNVKGNARALCTALTTILGVGGTVQDKGGGQADVEVQGEQMDRVGRALQQLGCARGLAVLAEPTVVKRDCAYDEFLRQGGNQVDATSTRRKPRHIAAVEIQFEEPPEDAPCRKWHGTWLYCRGHCEQTDLSGVWAEELNVPKIPTKTASPTMSVSAISSALSQLGMLAEIGAPVGAWLAQKEQLTLNAERRRVAPTPSLCAAANAAAATREVREFRCEQCGAAFGMKKTLQRHLKNHQQQTESAVASTGSFWRQPTSEQSASANAWDEWGDEDAYNNLMTPSDSDEEKRAPKNSINLMSFMTCPPTNRNQSKRWEAPTNEDMAQCPVCSRFFPLAEVEPHLDICLAGVPAETSAASSSGVLAHDADDDGTLPPELLESLLELELPEAAADFFWDRLADGMNRPGGKPVREAFLMAMEEALNFDMSRGTGASSSMSSRGSLDAPKTSNVISNGRGSVDIPVNPPQNQTQTLDTSAKATANATASSSGAAARGNRWNKKARANKEEVPSGYVGGKCNSQKEVIGNTNFDCADSKSHAAWLCGVLADLIGTADAESVAAGIEIVLANEDDEDAASNAVELLMAEIPDSARGKTVVADFRSRLNAPART